jgi:FixJ family two-component response regulator
VSEQTPIVLVVDDNRPVREAIRSLIASAGLHVETFASAEEFLNRRRPPGPACVVLDVRLPGLSGLDLQQEMSKAGPSIPIVFITGNGDIPMSVRAMKAGAVDFLTKPFSDQALLEAIRQAIERDRAHSAATAALRALLLRYASLTRRQRDVMSLVVAGLRNKQIASRLGISEISVKVHRASVMRKMAADSLAALVRMAGKATPAGPASPRARHNREAS